MRSMLPLWSIGKALVQSPWMMVLVKMVMGWSFSVGGYVSEGVAQGRLEAVAPVGIEAEGNAAFSQFADIEHGAVVLLLEQDADLAGVPVAGIVEQKDVE